MRRDLEPVKEVKINTKSIILGSFLFALFFFIIGAICRHYVWISA